MKPSARIESVVFQLTPTRTRCDLVITANGKTEKIASGLFDPFLAHLKSAQEQIRKGGYSIILKPRKDCDAAWFTKGTVERFVRFVNTPAILERVYTIESEIAHIGEAISYKTNNDVGLPTEEEQQFKFKKSSEGRQPALAANEEKAIVLYESNVPPPDAEGSNMQDKSSRKIRMNLSRVLETRRSALHKEQEMAFARAAAAGFDIDHITSLMSFAECFGASRLMEACSRFVELWKVKHESGELLEIKAAEAISTCASMNASRNVVPNLNGIQKETQPQSGLNSSNSGSPSNAPVADCPPQHGPADHQEQNSCQFRHPGHPPRNCSQSNELRKIQLYPLPVPYYQNYLKSGPFLQPSYASIDVTKEHLGPKVRQRKHLMDSRDSNCESNTWDVDDLVRTTSSGSDIDEDSQSQRVRKKGRKSDLEESEVVVIHNINYVDPKQKEFSGSDSQLSASEDEANGAHNVTKRNSSWNTKQVGSHRSSTDSLRLYDKEDIVADHVDCHWQAFQHFLLTDANGDTMSADDEGARRHAAVTDDSSVVRGTQCLSEAQISMPITDDDFVGKMTCRLKPTSFAQSITSSDGQANGRRVECRDNVAVTEDFMIQGQNEPADSSFSDALKGGELNNRHVKTKSTPCAMEDGSFIVPCRSHSLDEAGFVETEATYMDSVIPTGYLIGQQIYESLDLNLLPSRVQEDRMTNFDPSFDSELQAANLDNDKMINSIKQVTNKGVKVQGLKFEKKNTTVAKREKSVKLGPSDEVQARAEKLRNFKGDLQKLKIAKEEEQIKWLESLKKERQKRIAARSSGNSPQAKRTLPTKLSPSSPKSSKFSDSEPGSSSPLQRSTIKSIAKFSANTDKTFRPTENCLIKSISSPVKKKSEKIWPTSDSKVSLARIKRLSEPKDGSYAVSSHSADTLSRSLSTGNETKKSSPIVNLEKSKFSALPQRKAEISKEHQVSHVTQKTLSAVGLMPKMVVNLSYASTSVIEKGANHKASSESDYNDNTIVEKNMCFEDEKPSFSALQASDSGRDSQNEKSNIYITKERDEETMSVNAHATPCDVKEIRTDPQESQHSEKFHVNEGGVVPTEIVLPLIVDADETKEPHHAPHAQSSSLEDLFMGKSAKAPPRSPDMATTGAELTDPDVIDNSRQHKLDRIWETLEKPVEKGTLKGWKRLLKFRRRKQNSIPGESALNLEPVALGDGLTTDEHVTNAGSSGEAIITLRSLIYQDEVTPTSGQSTPHKSSRTFSLLLSPFRRKRREKKLSTGSIPWTIR